MKQDKRFLIYEDRKTTGITRGFAWLKKMNQGEREGEVVLKKISCLKVGQTAHFPAASIQRVR